MTTPNIAETLEFVAPYTERALADHADWLNYHHGGHITGGLPYLALQWALCEAYDIPVDRIETGVAWVNHDRGFGEKSHSGFGSKEARSAYMIARDLDQEGWGQARIQKVTRPIMATWLEGEITDTNDLIVVRTDIHNIWEDYRPMARAALDLRREEEKMCEQPMTFDDLKQKVEYRLGEKYLSRDMALTPQERLSNGNSLPNVLGLQNVQRFLNETPESLSQILNIPPEQIA